jgi:integrase
MFTDATFHFLLSKDIENDKSTVYYSAFKLFADFIGSDIFVKQIKQNHLKNFSVYLKQKEKSSNTIATYLNHLCIFSRWLLQEKYIDNDFSYKIRPHKKEPMIIPDLVLRKLFLYLYIHSKEQYRLIKFLYLTGFRKSEALNLQWHQIDFKTKAIYLENTKAKRTDIFPLYPELEKLLNSIPKTSAKLFSYSGDGLKFYNRALDRLKLKHYSLHDLRRKFGTMMAERGLTPYELQRVMRHQNIKTTMQYYINIDMQNIASKM